jgi:hypothetical protein
MYNNTPIATRKTQLQPCQRFPFFYGRESETGAGTALAMHIPMYNTAMSEKLQHPSHPATPFPAFFHGRESETGEGKPHGNSDYFFDLQPRPDLDHRHRDLPPHVMEATAAAAAEKEGPANRYVLCARDAGNVARFINHSCEPNLCVQPILAGHTDTRHVLIALVAMQDIPSFTPLRYDRAGSVLYRHALFFQPWL